MNCLSLVILFISCSNSFAVSCITTGDKKSVTESLENFDVDGFMEKIGKLESVSNADASLCGVSIGINYAKQGLAVQLTPNIEANELEDQYIQIQTSVEGIMIETINVQHYIFYACSYDQCQINFLNQHIQWLLDAKYPQLSNQLAPLILGDDAEAGKCYDDKDMLDYCNTGQCVANIQLINKKTKTTRRCADDEKLPEPGLTFMASFDLNLSFIVIQIEFRCKYDECNNQSMMLNAITIFDEVYNTSSVIAMLRYKKESEGQQQTTTTSFTSSSIPTLSTTSASAPSSTTIMQSTIIKLVIKLSLLLLLYLFFT